MRTPATSLIAVPLAALAALAVAGCGGGGDETTRPRRAVTTTEAPTALSKDGTDRQGDAICAEVNAAVGTLGAESRTEAAEQVAQEADLYTGHGRTAQGPRHAARKRRRLRRIHRPPRKNSPRPRAKSKLAAERGERSRWAKRPDRSLAGARTFQSAAATTASRTAREAPERARSRPRGARRRRTEAEEEGGVEEAARSRRSAPRKKSPPKKPRPKPAAPAAAPKPAAAPAAAAAKAAAAPASAPAGSAQPAPSGAQSRPEDSSQAP